MKIQDIQDQVHTQDIPWTGAKYIFKNSPFKKYNFDFNSMINLILDLGRKTKTT